MIAILRLLQTDALPYPRATPSAESLLKKAFEGLQHIVAHGVLLASGAVGKTVEPGEAKGFVNADEQLVINTANAWIELYDRAPKDPVVILMGEDAADLEAMKTEQEERL